jgi:hypothetical protein
MESSLLLLMLNDNALSLPLVVIRQTSQSIRKSVKSGVFNLTGFSSEQFGEFPLWLSRWINLIKTA